MIKKISTGIFSFLTIILLSNSSSAGNLTTIVIEVYGNGTVNSSPGAISCPDQCEDVFFKGDTITLTAVPDDGHSFIGWRGDCFGNEPVCNIKAAKAQNILALFSFTETSFPAPLPRTGQTTCYDINGYVIACAGTGQDGDCKIGVPWPEPRFNDHGNGTVTDNLTGLMWTKDTRLINPVGSVQMDWQEALDACNNLLFGSYDDWRMPNIVELVSLKDHENSGIMFPVGHPFSNVSQGYYWSSTTNGDEPSRAWVFNTGTISGHGGADKVDAGRIVWPVRGPDF